MWAHLGPTNGQRKATGGQKVAKGRQQEEAKEREETDQIPTQPSPTQSQTNPNGIPKVTMDNPGPSKLDSNSGPPMYLVVIRTNWDPVNWEPAGWDAAHWDPAQVARCGPEVVPI